MKEALKLALEMVQTKMYAHAEMYLKEALAQDEASSSRAAQRTWVGSGDLEDSNAYLTLPAAQPVQEPVAWLDEEKKIIYWHNTHETDDYHGFKRSTPLYTTPQQRPWVGLTEAQFLEAVRLAENGNYLVAFVRIQEWLKEQNNG